MNQALLILDLDETLVHATTESRTSGYDLRVLDYFVQKRPHLEEFLDTVFAWFDVAVWTSSGSTYAATLVPLIFSSPERLKFVWDGRRCTVRRDLNTGTYYNIKDLKKVKRRGYSLERVVMIDDTPEKLSRNYGNHLMLTPFEGDAADRELLRVLPYLKWLSNQGSFRSINKRRWREWREPSNEL